MRRKIDGACACRTAIIAGLLVWSTVPSRAADSDQLYVQGVMAIRRQQWAEAKKLISAAVAANPNEDRHTVYINHSDEPPYVPHYYLGLALLRLGECPGALREWKISESQGVVQKTSEYKSLIRNRKECPEEPAVDPAVLAQAVQKANGAIETADRLLTDLKNESTDPLAAAVWTSATGLRDGRSSAERQLGDLRATIEKARAASNVDDLERSAAAAGKIGEVLRSIEGQFQTALRQERQKAGEREVMARLRNEVRTKSSRAAETLKALRAAKLEPNGQGVLERLTQTVAMIDGSAGTATRADLTKWSSDLDELLRSASIILKQPVPRTPEELFAAAKAFFGGDYRAALIALQNTGQFTGRAKSEAMLLRAASAYALYAMTNDASLRAAAVADVRTCRGLQDAPNPSAQYFSPRFVDFYGSVK